MSSTEPRLASRPIQPKEEDEGDEIKVFRTTEAEDADATDIASSSAELTADKKDLALEAEIESQTEPMGQRMITPLQSAFNCMPSPSYNFLVPLFMSSPSPLSPLHSYAAVAAAAASAYANNPLLRMQMSPSYTMAQMHLAAAAANLARHSPTYMQFGNAGFPGMSMGTPTNSNGSAMNGGNLNHHLFHPSPSRANSSSTQPHLNSPLTSVSNVLNGISLSADGHNKHTPNSHRSAYRHHNATQSSSAQQQPSNKTPKREKPVKSQSEKKDKNHIKKPCNAFMWFMKVNRANLLEQEGGQQKQSAMLNQQLGKIWQGMPKKDQQKYYDMAAQEREDHQRKYPMWTARENYAIHKKKKKKREKSMENNDQKKCRARFGIERQDLWCKHCRRKKRCLNVREDESPMGGMGMVSSTTNPTTPQGMGSSASSSHHVGSPSSSKRTESNSSSSYDPNTPPPPRDMAGYMKVLGEQVRKVEQQDGLELPKPTPGFMGQQPTNFMPFGGYHPPNVLMPPASNPDAMLNFTTSNNSNNNF